MPYSCRPLHLGLLALLAAATPARAEDILSLLLGPAPHETPGFWTAEVDREARDPAWTATVAYARRAPAFETGSVGPVIARQAPHLTGAPHALDGVASYYWQDQMTASGEVFDKRGMTAAHKTLPLGSRVRVTNLDNGRSTVLRINDRGPYVKGRVIDVSEAAADVLDMRHQGLAPVRVELVQNDN